MSSALKALVVLATRGNIASWRGQAGDPAGAAAASEQLLTDFLRVLGPDHPDTLTTPRLTLIILSGTGSTCNTRGSLRLARTS